MGRWKRLAPSHRRACLGWITSAKRRETKARQLKEAIVRLTIGRGSSA